MFKGLNALDDLHDGRNPALMRQREETGLTIVMNFRIQCHWFSAKNCPPGQVQWASRLAAGRPSSGRCAPGRPSSRTRRTPSRTSSSSDLAQW